MATPGETSLPSLGVEAPGPGAAYLICLFATLEGSREGVREQQIQKGNRAENIYKFKIRPKWKTEKSLRRESKTQPQCGDKAGAQLHCRENSTPEMIQEMLNAGGPSGSWERMVQRCTTMSRDKRMRKGRWMCPHRGAEKYIRGLMFILGAAIWLSG